MRYPPGSLQNGSCLFNLPRHILQSLIVTSRGASLIVRFDVLFGADREEIQRRKRDARPDRPVLEIGSQPAGRASGVTIRPDACSPGVIGALKIQAGIVGTAERLLASLNLLDRGLAGQRQWMLRRSRRRRWRFGRRIEQRSGLNGDAIRSHPQQLSQGGARHIA